MGGTGALVISGMHGPPAGAVVRPASHLPPSWCRKWWRPEVMAMSGEDESPDRNAQAEGAAERPSHRMRIPGFVTGDEEVGLGDVVKRMTNAAGIRPCGGCEQRAAALNGWVAFSPGRGRRN